MELLFCQKTIGSLYLKLKYVLHDHVRKCHFYKHLLEGYFKNLSMWYMTILGYIVLRKAIGSFKYVVMFINNQLTNISSHEVHKLMQRFLKYFLNVFRTINLLLLYDKSSLKRYGSLQYDIFQNMLKNVVEDLKIHSWRGFIVNYT